MHHFVYVLILSVLNYTNSQQFKQSPSIKGKDQPLIIGGSKTADGELPYQILLQHQGQYICGGSFINVNGTHFVLTAAHCVGTRHPSRYTVVAGETDRNTASGNEQLRNVKTVFRHGQYSSRTLQNDIALLAIDEPFEVNEFVSPIPLPKQGQDTTGEVVVSGWGYITPIGIASRYLKKVTISVIDNLACKAFYAIRLLYVTNSMLCAGRVRGLSDSCNGDSGGPLTTVDGGYLAGIVSWGTLCALPLQPGVYTQVSHYIDWIELQASSI